MQSRMDRYSFNDDGLETRVSKNKKIYDKIYGDSFLNEERLPVSDNSNVIDMETLKNLTSEKKEMRKEINEEYQDIKKNQKVYDINELLNQIKDEKDINNNDIIKIERNFLNNLESNKYDKVEDKTDDMLSKTTTLSLDILSDLKPSDDTVVTDPVDVDQDDVLTNITNVSDEKEEFYSGALNFKAEDFDDYFEKPKKSRIFKIVIILFIICLFVLLGFYLLQYFDINIEDFFNKW